VKVPPGQENVTGVFSGALATQESASEPSVAISAVERVPAGNGIRTSATVLTGTVAVSMNDEALLSHSTATSPAIDAKDEEAEGRLG
jgi:hypothetical protein